LIGILPLACLQVVSEVNLLLSHYHGMRKALHVSWLLQRASTLRAASIDCMGYKELTVPE
jgi:hypothetical protein